VQTGAAVSDETSAARQRAHALVLVPTETELAVARNGFAMSGRDTGDNPLPFPQGVKPMAFEISPNRGNGRTAPFSETNDADQGAKRADSAAPADRLVDEIAERIQTLGGVAIAMAADVAETTRLVRPPRDREAPAQQLARLVDAHERLLYGVRAAARRAAELGDDGTNDLLVGDVIRDNERQAWFVQEQLHRSPMGGER
jgi:hypothetical protein